MADDGNNSKDIEMEEKDKELEKEQASLIEEYDATDDPMHVDFNEGQWLPCIPGLSLTSATVIFAIIGATIGIIIAVVNPVSQTSIDHRVMTVNVTDALYDDSLNYSNVDIKDVSLENGTYLFDFVYDVPYTTMETVELPTLSEEWAKIIEFPGKVWVNALKLLVLPLLILMMVVLPSRVDEIGFIAKRSIPLYLFTSSCAAIQGTIWAWVIQPGNIGSPPEDVGTREAGDDISELDALLNIFYNAVPSNIVSAMANLTILGVILFFLAIGMLLRRPEVKEEERTVVLRFSRAILRCCMLAVIWVIWFTPIGMGSLVCIKIASTDDLGGLLAALGFYVMTVLIGHSVHVFGFYPLTFFATTRGNGWAWFRRIYEAPLLAFATSSSAATLPRSLLVARKAGVRPEVYKFILPLGSAINMDGTALGFPIMIGLIAQLNNVQLDFGTILVVMLLSVVISVGTAPIPNAGMVYLTMLFSAAGMAEYAGEGLATLFVLDWFVDRIETAVNVTSDLFVAKIMDEVSQNAQNKELNVVCGCCLGPKRPEIAYEQTANNEAGQTELV
eukprot:CAMPEP_0202688108 /NCGR_PEP_ID=MMETSP1385-20130828/3642_1 /ASSEMBLY_ACC=CAM_ASM_000861 /TAXON_ID=933848 /ORGANISM="Elphidium margaritaceum" /LENGTH=558 /DNA_ID=CAMNT_0049342999 /DNA_START=94 /DNA_END=1770 /DNA_ORIENTATION=+